MSPIKQRNRNRHGYEQHVPGLPPQASLPPASGVGAPANTRLEAARIRKRGILVGTDRQDGQRLYMDPQYLATHLHVLGLTGSGKTRWLGWLFRLLAADPGHTIILIDPKGDLFHLAKRLAIADGLTKRLVLFDLGDPAYRLGFNPLRPNGLPTEIHAKAVRESIRSAWAAEDFFQTPQLARWLYLSLAIARTLELTLVEALQVITPLSPLRKAVLPKLKDPYLKGSLEYLDKLPERRQDELVAPCLARLEAFVMDSMIRDLLTKQSPALDLADIIERRQILLVNASKYRPMRKDDCSLLLCMLVNDLVIKAFERPEGKRSPVILLADEVHNLATFDFCQVLDEGRSLGLWCVLAHQFLQQLRDEERSGYLYYSVMADARSKVLFNALPEDVEELAKGVFLDRWDPWLVKDEMDTLETEFREERRLSRNAGRSSSRGCTTTHSEGTSDARSTAATHTTSRSATAGTVDTHSWADTDGESLTDSEGWARTAADTEARTAMDGVARSVMNGISQMSGQGQMHGMSQAHGDTMIDTASTGLTRVFDSPVAVLPVTWVRSTGAMTGASASDVAAKSDGESAFSGRGSTAIEGETVQHADAYTQARTLAQTVSGSHARSVSHSHTDGHSHGEISMETQGVADALTQGQTTARSRGVAHGTSEEEGWNEGVSEAPFLAPYARRVPSSRAFLTWDEYSLACVRDVIAQDTGQAVVKFPLLPAAFLDVPWYAEPTLTRKALARAEERIRANLLVEVLPPAADAALPSAPINITPMPVPAIPMEASPAETAPEAHDRSRFRRPRTPPA